jgi:hypothetical protein
MHAINLSSIANMVSTCLELHSMGVSDRVMGNANTPYIASTYAEVERATDTIDAIILPVGINSSLLVGQSISVTTVAQFNSVLAETVANNKEWKQLKDPVEWARLQTSLISSKGCIS